MVDDVVVVVVPWQLPDVAENIRDLAQEVQASIV